MKTGLFQKYLAAFFVAAFLNAVATPTIGNAQEGQAIAILNMGKLLTDSAAVKSVNSQAKKLQESHLAKIKEMDARLREERTKLLQMKSILPKDQYDEKVKTFVAKTTKIREGFKRAEKQLRVGKSNALGKIRKAITPIVTKIVNERKIGMVIPKVEVLFGKKELDITDTVLAELDKSLKTVKIVVPKPANE